MAGASSRKDTRYCQHGLCERIPQRFTGNFGLFLCGGNCVQSEQKKHLKSWHVRFDRCKLRLPQSQDTLHEGTIFSCPLVRLKKLESTSRANSRRSVFVSQPFFSVFVFRAHAGSWRLSWMMLPTSSLSGQLCLHYLKGACMRAREGCIWRGSLIENIYCVSLCRRPVANETMLRLHILSAVPPDGSSDFCHWGSRFRFQAHDPTHGAIHNHIHWLDHQVSVVVHR